MGDQQGGFLAGLGGVRVVGGQRGGCSWLSPEGLATAHGACLLQDFGMSGLRFGTLYTENRAVATAVASLCRYHGLSGLVQYQMAQLLRDRGDCLGLAP